MRRSALALATILPLAFQFALPAHADKPRKPRPDSPAAQYPLHETHPTDHLTIAAEPGDIKETAPNTRLDYTHHGFTSFRVIVTNDSDVAISLDDARIKFISAHNDIIQAATDEELQRRMFSKKHADGTKIPLPLPIPDITIHHEPVDKQILADDRDFGFPTTTVAPHTTVSGYIYYDTRDIDDPVLDGATLEVRKVRIASTNQELQSFEIPLKPTPITNPAKPAAPNPTTKNPPTPSPNLQNP